MRSFPQVAACALAAGLAGTIQAIAASPSSVTPSPAGGHPTELVAVSGSGFADSEAVDVYFDTTDTLLLVTSATGTFTGKITLPAGAAPGIHYITAVGRRSTDAAQGAVTVTTPWNESGFGAARRGWNPYENQLNKTNVSSLGELWTTNTLSYGGTPVVAAGSVYVTGNGGIIKLSSATGAGMWVEENGTPFQSSPVIVGGTLYAASYGGTVFSLNASSGAQNWNATLGGYIVSSPVVVNGILYVGCEDNKLYALNASTGVVLWTYATGSAINSSPAVAGGVVYIGSNDDNLYAVNAETGVLLWNFATAGDVETSPVVVNGTVYVGSDDGFLYAFSAKGSIAGALPPGTLLWNANLSGGLTNVSPAVAAGIIYVGAYNEPLYALDATTGATLWSFQTTSFPRSAAVANGVVYFTDNLSGFLYALDASTGAKLWAGEPGSTFRGSPAISDGVVYVNAYDGYTTAYALLAGNSSVRKPTHAPAIKSLHRDMRLAATR